MNTFEYRDGSLFAEGVALSAIAQRFGTPTYVYSRAHIEGQYRAYADALAGMPNLVCYAVCLLYTSPSPRDKRQSRMPSSA